DVAVAGAVPHVDQPAGRPPAAGVLAAQVDRGTGREAVGVDDDDGVLGRAAGRPVRQAGEPDRVGRRRRGRGDLPERAPRRRVPLVLGVVWAYRCCPGPGGPLGRKPPGGTWVRLGPDLGARRYWAPHECAAEPDLAGAGVQGA